jgi:cobalt-precorrin 5A hydrolase
MGGEEAVIAAGLGFRHGVTPEELVAIVTRAMAEAALAPGDLAHLATAEERAAEPAFTAAARVLNASPIAVTLEAMRRVAPAVRTISPRVMAAYGVGSVAEAAALGCFEGAAHLMLPRIASARATCAIARGILA